jgi:hypothetical protein
LASAARAAARISATDIFFFSAIECPGKARLSAPVSIRACKRIQSQKAGFDRDFESS